MTAYLRRMPSGIPGDVTRKGVSVVEPVPLNSALPFSGFGLPGKIVAGKFVPLAGGEAATDIHGFLVRPFPIQTANADGSGMPISPVGDRLAFGYISVKNNAGTPAKGGAVYVRVANAAAGKPIGGIEAVADSTNTVVIPRCIFMDAGDASGNVEIRYGDI